MNVSATTKGNLLHLLKELKQFENEYGFDKFPYWDEYDLTYLIALVEKDIETDESQ